MKSALCPAFAHDPTPTAAGVGDSITPGKGTRLACCLPVHASGNHRCVTPNVILEWRYEGGVPFKMQT